MGRCDGRWDRKYDPIATRSTCPHRMGPLHFLLTGGRCSMVVCGEGDKGWYGIGLMVGFGLRGSQLHVHVLPSTCM